MKTPATPAATAIQPRPIPRSCTDGVEPSSTAATAVPARTTYRDLVRGRMIALVATERRIPPDPPAVASGGIIGRVIRSEGRRCWIELITHPVAAIAGAERQRKDANAARNLGELEDEIAVVRKACQWIVGGPFEHASVFDRCSRVVCKHLEGAPVRVGENLV